jgi:hypothetical protein
MLQRNRPMLAYTSVIKWKLQDGPVGLSLKS